MQVFDYLGKGVAAMLHPGEANKRSLDVGTAYMTYYKTTFVPLVVYVLLSIVFVSAEGYVLILRSFTAPLLGAGLLGALVIPIAIVWVFMPIGIFVSAGLLQLVGRAAGQFKGPFGKTLTAVMYSKFPVAIFAFLLAIPFAAPLFTVFGFWAFVVSLVALSSQQKVSWATALGLEVMTIVLALALLGIVASLLAISFGSSAIAWLIQHYGTLMNLAV